MGLEKVAPDFYKKHMDIIHGVVPLVTTGLGFGLGLGVGLPRVTSFAIGQSTDTLAKEARLIAAKVFPKAVPYLGGATAQVKGYMPTAQSMELVSGFQDRPMAGYQSRLLEGYQTKLLSGYSPQSVGACTMGMNYDSPGELTDLHSYGLKGSYQTLLAKIRAQRARTGSWSIM
jgi:hypothetical protein